MFQKLKVRLILINVVSLTIVLVMIFSGIYIITVNGMNKQSWIIINDIAKEGHVVPAIDTPPGTDRVLSNSFFIKTDTKGSTFEYSPDMAVSKAEAEELKNIVLDKGTQRGNIQNSHFKLAFLKEPKSYGYIIVFLDNSVETGIHKLLIIAFLSVGIVSLLLVFLISLYLASKAIVPVKTSWEKQNAFIADASHELRTPLAVLNSNLEIVVDNEDKTVGSQIKWLTNIQGEIARMTKLVEDLLFLARADEEEMPMSTFNISNTIQRTYEVFKPLSDKKGLNLAFKVKPDLVIWGNEGRILQLINILLDNAIKHTTSGGNIEFEILEREGLYELIIKDTGEGIPKEDIDKIFERFYRVDKARSRSHGGSGLGLSIAKCIVKEHEGSIKVYSTVGKGAEFHIILPVRSTLH